MNETVEEREIHLKDYLRVIKKRRWTVIAFFVVVVTIVMLHTFTAKPLYEATSQVLIEKENANIVSFEEVLNLDTAHADYFNTQYKILKSRSLARVVFDAAGLDKSPQFKELEDPVTAFLRNLNVKPIRDSRLVELSVTGLRPDEITRICNLWAKLYIDQNLLNRMSASSQAVRWLSEKVEALQDNVKRSELALQKYKEENSIISLEEKQNIVVQKLSELNSSVIEANRKRITLETRYTQLMSLLKEEGWQSLTNITENTLILNLKNDLVKLEEEKAKLSLTYKEKHPKLARIISQIALLKKSLKEEIGKVVSNAGNEFKIASIEEDVLREALGEQKREALDMNKKAIQYNVLKREAEGNQKLFDVLLNRLKETSLTEGLEFNNIRVVDYAEVPTRPIKPKKRLNLLLAIIVGLLGGCSLAFFLEYLDNSIKNSEDVERFLGLPFLAPIPATDKKGMDSLYLITQSMPKSVVSEAFRSLRTSILFSSSSDRELKSIMITSAGPSEGKTTTGVNLSIAMSLGEKKVLIVDCDLRKPSLHKVFSRPNDAGISNLVVDHNRAIEEVIQETGINNLHLITSGPIPPNPSELLGSHRMSEIMKQLEDSYDWIIYDSPPVMSVTDATIVGRLVEGVVLVVDATSTSRESAVASKRALSEVGANIIGVALNKADIREEGYYSYYYEYGKEGA